ncbi:MAG: hypothetical protein ABW122_09250, partial [Ilumatobacteraceae bacterium]
MSRPLTGSVGRYRSIAVCGGIAAVAYIVVLVWSMSHISYDIWGAMVIGPVLVLVSIPILERAGRADPGRRTTRLLFCAFFAKMIGTLLRYAVTFEVYGGRADAGGYHGSGSRLAAAFWDGNWDRVVHDEVPELIGTEFVRLTTGLMYIVTGPTKLGGFLLYGWLGFWGVFLFYRAFRIAVPGGDHWRYGLLVFFLPSLLYWPSSIGKESWMLFTLGIVAYGASLVLTYRPHGYLVLVVGLAGTAAVRPHISLFAFGALFLALVLRRRSWRDSRLGLLGRIVGLAAMIGIGAVVVTTAASFFNVGDVTELSGDSVDTVLDRTTDQSSTGGSEFESTRLTSPAEYPSALVSVLFRPFPWEAGNAQALAASAEGFVLLLVSIGSWRRIVRVPRAVVQIPYVAFAVSYTLMFVFAFSAVNNFGILSRQRTQVLPLFLVVLAIPLANESRQQSERPPPRPIARPVPRPRPPRRPTHPVQP